MTNRTPSNVAASIHQRLLNVAKQTDRPFNDLVLYYAIERFLYRLSQSPYAHRVVLKGGLMLQVWNAPETSATPGISATPATRVTRDIDLLGKVTNDLGQVGDIVRSVCTIVVEDDALVFDPQSVATKRIVEDADYEGVRATFKGRLGKMSVAMQIDFGFGDIITPAPTTITYPSVLNHPPAQLLAYNRETAVAEKFEAMVKLGELNSRMKDFFDVWLLAQGFAFEGSLLTDAIRSTFNRRQTTIDPQPACFSERFANAPAKAAQWKGFIKTSRVERAPTDFAEVIARVGRFLQPVAKALAEARGFRQHWPPGGDWR